jgi:Cu(I)/Ag(I) efflux system membrane fusion protein
MNRINLLFIGLLAAIFLFSCQQSNQTASSEAKITSERVEQNYLKTQVKNELNQYYVLKDALVKTDASSSQVAATELLQMIESVDASQIVPSYAERFSSHAETLKAATSKIASSTDVEEQRIAFETVTTEMVALVKAFRPSDEDIYYQFCPMAFDFKGAHWLSNEEKIMNPYFGDKMLHCGKVEAEL